MIVTTEESSDKTNQATLSIYTPNTLSNGAISFDIMAPVDGTLINISVFEADTDKMIQLGQVTATTEFKTYVFDINCAAFIRFNFQDANGEGIEFHLKNILYTPGPSSVFKKEQIYDIITIYGNEDFFPKEFQNWSWETDVYFDEGAMIVTTEESSDKTNQATLSIYTPNTLSNGAISFDIMAPVDGTLINFSVFEADTDKMIQLGQVIATTEFKTYVFDINCAAFIRFNFQDANGEGIEFHLKNILYTPGPSSVFKKEQTYDIITIYGNEEFFPKEFQNWSWETDVYFDEGAMIVTTEESSDKTNQATLSIYTPNTLSNGAISFDIMAPADGTLINISVFEADTDKMIQLGQVIATTEFKTYVFDINCAAFIRFNFQDANGEGIEFHLKNILYTPGPSSVFKKEQTYDIITIYGNEEFFPKEFQNWSWETDVYFDESAMIVTTEESSDKTNQATLSIYTPNTLSNGAISFDIMAPVDGTLINISVFEADTDKMIQLGQVIATTEFKTYVFDINCAAFIRFNFQDANGEGIEFHLKNIRYTTGPSSSFS
ncbi:carbohydrate-binding module family 29 protein [Piromyces sp. E2]|nr:carbohydrate-binding module family 29 protein [Piromyces sp. E2]|eukprot:OUM69097.1 carbohydrate-binding module family 29 protein [Piromyces sp. E2]